MFKKASDKTVSEATAQAYLNSITNPVSRIEYIFLLKEANDEGRVMREMGAAIDTKEQWFKTEHWARFTKDLREEFYLAYRAGYARNIKGDD